MSGNGEFPKWSWINKTITSRAPKTSKTACWTLIWDSLTNPTNLTLTEPLGLGLLALIWIKAIKTLSISLGFCIQKYENIFTIFKMPSLWARSSAATRCCTGMWDLDYRGQKFPFYEPYSKSLTEIRSYSLCDSMTTAEAHKHPQGILQFFLSSPKSDGKRIKK